MYRVKNRIIFPKRYKDQLSSELTVFQTARIQRELNKNILFYAVPKKMIPKVYEVYDGEKLVCIFPALVNNDVLELAGVAQGLSNLSPIYFNCSKDITSALAFLFADLKCKEIRIDRVLEGSYSATLLENLSGYIINKTLIENVRICFDSYDEWFSSLRKSVRQNLRTAYNRMDKDESTFRVNLFTGESIPKPLMKKLVTIYNNRHAEHYQVKTSTIKKFYLQHLDFSTRDLSRNPAARHAVLYINNEVAAFFSGYYDLFSKSIIIPRLSINPTFSRYSPGYVLLSETIKEYSNCNDVNCLDLSTGVEKYKLDLGGTIYYKIKYKLRKH